MCYHCCVREKGRTAFLGKIFWGHGFTVTKEAFVVVRTEKLMHARTHTGVRLSLSQCYTQNLWCSTSVACVLLLFSLLKVSEVFITRQRRHQLTWQADLKDGEGGARVPSCTHHSAVQPDLWPCRVFFQPPSALGFLPLSVSLVFTWIGHCYTKGPVCHQN